MGLKSDGQHNGMGRNSKGLRMGLKRHASIINGPQFKGLRMGLKTSRDVLATNIGRSFGTTFWEKCVANRSQMV
jgi:hypothetical protein